MAVYFITGKLGAGKTLCAVGRIKEYLQTGRTVATNLDLQLDNMFPETSKQSAIRLPDKPRLSDFEDLGKGCIEEDESKYGLIVLDELGTWFNSRNWRDKGRLDVIDWFLHARKMHWDIFFIVQSIDSLDGQLVNARFIPTGVGNTPASSRYDLNVTVHPHGCGEHAVGAGISNS